MRQPGRRDLQRHLSGQFFAAFELAGFERRAHRVLDLPLRADADDLQKLADFHVEAVIVHGVLHPCCITILPCAAIFAMTTRSMPAVLPDQGPLSIYRARRAAGDLMPDPSQELAAEKLQSLWRALLDYKPATGMRGWAVRVGLGVAEPPQGLYLCGPVGRGKTMLMDMFYESLGLPHKRRVHFYAFMIEVHDRIHAREAEKGDPIGPVAAIIANDASVLCFDEFHITNIADAMILGRLFEALFDRGVVVVATSNRAPGELYEGGLQRERFLPFIELFKRKLDVLELGGERDYRRARLAGRREIDLPADDRAYRALEHAFIELTGNASARAETLTVQGHDLVVPRGARHDQIVSLDGQRLGTRRGVAGQLDKCVLQRTIGAVVGRREIDLPAGKPGAAIVALAAELQHVELALEKLDEGQETFALQAALVELAGRAVRGRDHDDAAIEQRLEQPPQDHRIGDVGDMEFVEAEHRCIVGDDRGDGTDRVAFFGLPRMDAVMHLDHEGVEMDAPLMRQAQRLVEHVHQHGLAAADRAAEIEPLRRLGDAQAYARRPAAHAGRRLVIEQRPPQTLQLLGGELLAGIWHKVARRAAGAVDGQRALIGEDSGHRPRCHSENRRAWQNRDATGMENPMNDDRFNMEVRKFLKIVGVSSQREIENAVRAALESGKLKGSEKLAAKMTLQIPAAGLSHTIDGTIELG